jgi:hypothetical protein
MSRKRKIRWNPEESLPISPVDSDFAAVIARVEKQRATRKKWRRASSASVMGIGLLVLLVAIFFDWQTSDPIKKRTTTRTDLLPLGPHEDSESRIIIPSLAVSQKKSTATSPENHVAANDGTISDTFAPSDYTKAHPVVGMDSLYAYINTGINQLLLDGEYTEVTNAKATIRFQIDASRRPLKIMVSDLENPKLVEEIIQFFGEMPDWEPATANGEPITTWFSIPLILNYQTFSDQEENK